MDDVIIESVGPEPGGWDLWHLKFAINGAGVALWSWDVSTDKLVLDERAYDLWGLQDKSDVVFDDLSAQIHPSDRDRVGEAFSSIRVIMGPYEIDFRIIVNEEVRWVSARGQGNSSGMSGRRMFGIFLDVTGRKQAEEANELLAGEMSHRVKNLLAIAAGLTYITSRTSDTIEDMAQQLTTRLTALGRAHDLVRPLPGHAPFAALLGDLLTVLLAPYDEHGAEPGRIQVSTPRMGVGNGAATTLALIIHELATNSLKYGALGATAGALRVTCAAAQDMVTIAWSESGCPLARQGLGPSGFGSQLVKDAIVGQLGGSIAYEWTADGVHVAIEIDRERLER